VADSPTTDSSIMIPPNIRIALFRSLTWCGNAITETELDEAWSWVENHGGHVEEMGQ
jgi:hypothetical protein